MGRLGSEMRWEDLVQSYPSGECEVSLDTLLTPEEIAVIDSRFDSPLAREPWDGLDYSFVFASALIGILTDWFCAPLGNPLSRKLLSYGGQLHDESGIYRAFREFQHSLGKSALAQRFDWVRHLSGMKVTHSGLPIDHRGPGFGVGDGHGWVYHRILSSGHDLLRFMSGIHQIKTGQFIGTRYVNGKAVMEIRTLAASGTPYTPRGDWSTAAVEYLLHVVSDLFTKTSLPVPGATWLQELPSRKLRTFVREMYYGNSPWSPSGKGRPGSEFGGYNLRHVLGQSVTPATTQLAIWLYYHIRYSFPNWLGKEVAGQEVGSSRVPGLKLAELQAVAHATVAAVNVGRVIVVGNPLVLNLPQLTACMAALTRMTLINRRRFNIEARNERNRILLDEGWSSIEAMLEVPQERVIKLLPEETLVIG